MKPPMTEDEKIVYLLITLNQKMFWVGVIVAGIFLKEFFITG